MTKPSVQLIFPCPACGHVLNLQQFSASGPCPTCHTQLSVNLSVTAGHAPAGGDPTAQVVTPLQAGNASQLKYDERRFRPVLREPGEQTAP